MLVELSVLVDMLTDLRSMTSRQIRFRIYFIKRVRKLHSTMAALNGSGEKPQYLVVFH